MREWLRSDCAQSGSMSVITLTISPSLPDLQVFLKEEEFQRESVFKRFVLNLDFAQNSTSVRTFGSRYRNSCSVPDKQGQQQRQQLFLPSNRRFEQPLAFTISFPCSIVRQAPRNQAATDLHVVAACYCLVASVPSYLDTMRRRPWARVLIPIAIQSGTQRQTQG